MMPLRCGWSLHRARVRSMTCCTSRSARVRVPGLQLLRPVELAHAPDRLRDVVDGALNGHETGASLADSEPVSLSSIDSV